MHFARDIFYVAVVFWLLTEIWIRLREKGEAQTKRDSSSKRIILISVVFAISFGILLSDKTSLPIIRNQTTAFLAGGIITLIGVGFRIWSVVTLGNYFRTTVMTVKTQKVITHGPYKFIRHPSYSAILISLIGISIGINNWYAFVVMFLSISTGLSYRIAVEERILLSNLGKDYREYMNNTRKLIPFIY